MNISMCVYAALIAAGAAAAAATATITKEHIGAVRPCLAGAQGDYHPLSSAVLPSSNNSVLYLFPAATNPPLDRKPLPAPVLSSVVMASVAMLLFWSVMRLSMSMLQLVTAMGCVMATCAQTANMGKSSNNTLPKRQPYKVKLPDLLYYCAVLCIHITSQPGAPSHSMSVEWLPARGPMQWQRCHTPSQGPSCTLGQQPALTLFTISTAANRCTSAASHVSVPTSLAKVTPVYPTSGRRTPCSVCAQPRTAAPACCCSGTAAAP